MSRDPTRAGAPTVGDASDDEFMRAIRRAEARIEPPSETKMQELAARLPLSVATRSAGAFRWRWLAVVSMVSVFASSALFVRSRVDTRSNGFPATDTPLSVQPGPQVTTALPPPAETHDVAAPVFSVESLPAASAPAPVHRPPTEVACAGEIELVDRADVALRGGDARGALELARQHAERCPNGVFVQERERVAIEALARLDRTSEVRARAVAFEKRFPSSPHIRRIRSLAEGELE